MLRSTTRYDGRSRPVRGAVGAAILAIALPCAGCAAQTADDAVGSQASADLACQDATIADVRSAADCNPCLTTVRATCRDRVALYDCEEPTTWPNGPPCTRVALEDASLHVESDLGCPADEAQVSILSDTPDLGPAGSDISDSETWTVHVRGCGLDALYACANGCSLAAKTGGLSLDGVPISIVACRSGSSEAFFGFDVVDTRGTTVRLSVGVDGRTDAFLLSPEGAEMPLPGACATAELKPTADGGVAGTATFDCAASGRAVLGKLDIVDCR